MDKKIITRDFINDRAYFHLGYRSFNKEYLSISINFWKDILIQNGAKHGDKIGLAMLLGRISYLSLTFAAFELGLKLVILIKPYNDGDLQNPKVIKHYPLDILVIDKECVPPIVFDNFINNSKISLILEDNERLFNRYSITKKYSENVFANPTDTLLLCTSSGSTGEPKSIDHTHEFFYDLCSINWKSLELNENDRVLHLQTYQHGAAIGVFFIPALHKCHGHYFHIKGFELNDPSDSNWDLFPEFCNKHKITYVQCAYAYHTNLLIASIKRSDGVPNLTLSVLSYINPEWISVVKEGKLKKIISVFGCSETSGPLFIPYVDKNTENFNPEFIGNPIEDYHTINVVDKKLIVTVPTYNTTIDTGDFLEKTDKGFILLGKDKQFRINDIDINPNLIQKFFEDTIENIFSKELIVLVDEVYSKLYVITNKSDILSYTDKIRSLIKEYYWGHVELTDIIYIEKLQDFVLGIKPDREKLLNYVRQLKNEQYRS